MREEWTEAATTTHQDHVIAHVIGATVLGYFSLGETVHLLLDIGFLWKIYVDGEMGLLPHPVATAELEVDDEARAQIKHDIDLLLRGNVEASRLARLLPINVTSPITGVELQVRGEEYKLVLEGESGTVQILTSVSDGSIQVTEV
ncbi:MAG TPA: hypothetical protein VFH15_07850 [Pyrinomonadaceae bacterium]|nr:hypothetical protein [Pyrinomonadaceae bacterium]